MRFGLCTPRDANHERLWAGTLDYVTEHALHGLAADEPLLRAEAFRALATATITAFPNTALGAIEDPERPPPGGGEPAVVRRAIEFIDTHAAGDVGPGEIAAAAGTDPPGLRQAFLRHRGQTPAEYLWQARLDGAHRVLTTLADGAPTTQELVARVAARWGFLGTRRFAVAYHRTYGHPPGDTPPRDTDRT